MKRFLVIVLFLLIVTAVWFRWLDEIDPATVKAEFATQQVEFKEKMTDFSLKRELSQITTALDKFFSPKEDVEENESSFDYQASDFLTEEPSEEPEVYNMTEQEVLNALEEYQAEPTDIPAETGGLDVASTLDQGYPAPMMAPVTIVDPVGDAASDQRTDLNQSSGAVASDVPQVTETPVDIVVASEGELEEPAVVFNQLQESIPGSFLPYNLQSVEPLYTANFAHPEAGCDWMGVAGQIFDEDQQPVNGMVVVVEGVTNNTMIELLGYSGLADVYGPGGYELVLSNVNGPGIFWIQLFGEDGKPLSEIYSFQMDGTCEQNLAVINFTVKTEEQSKFVPTVNP